MALPIPTGESIGQSITINCTEQKDDFYFDDTAVELTTEYDLTKGVDITFDGQLYKNVPAQIIQDGGNELVLIGEFADDQPILTTYPFFIILKIDGGK